MGEHNGLGRRETRIIRKLQSEVQLQTRKSHKGYMQEEVRDSYKGTPKKFSSHSKMKMDSSRVIALAEQTF